VKLPRHARWAVPGGAVVAVGLVIAGSVIAGAQTTPRLPARTTAQLLAAAGRPAAAPPAMTAVVQETASLGLPQLPGSSDPLSPLSLLSGTHTFKIWYGGPAKVRVAVPVSLGETDLRRNGNSAWLWNSRTNQATHYLLPAPSAGSPWGASPPAARVGSIPTPQQLAQQILAAVGPTTTVGLQQNVTVAGRAAYQLSLAPKDRRSLIGRVQIAIDAQTSLPLRAQVFARGAPGPAFSVGYTSLSFGAPAASNFSFSPPPGAKVKTVKVPSPRGRMPIPVGAPGPAGQSSTQIISSSGTGTGTIGSVMVRGSKPVPAAVAKQIEASFAESLPASLSKAQRATLLKEFASHLQGRPKWDVTGPQSAVSISSAPVAVSTGPDGSTITEFLGTSAPAAPRVIGKDWLSVAVLPGGFSAHGGFLPQGTTEPGVPDALGALTSASTPVHGTWGSGRLLRTSLVSVLMTDKGSILVGAVVPSVLYADAAQLG
jgi:outer membrane lipoprotein-sorting protein